MEENDPRTEMDSAKRNQEFADLKVNYFLLATE